MNEAIFIGVDRNKLIKWLRNPSPTVIRDPSFFLSMGFDVSVVKGLNKMHHTEMDHPDNRIFRDGKVIERIKGVFEFDMLYELKEHARIKLLMSGTVLSHGLLVGAAVADKLEAEWLTP